MRSPIPSRAAAAASVLAASFAGAAAPGALAAPSVPAGYQVVDLGISCDTFGVGADGRLATAVTDGSSLTVTLYDRYLPAGRQQLGRIVATRNAPLFVTNLEFDGTSRVVFGENGSTSTVYAADFGNALPTLTGLSANGSFPGVQGVDVVGGRVIAEGSTASFGSTGGLYLRSLDPATGTVTPVVANAGTGYPGGTAVTPAGRYVLLDADFTTGGVARLYNPDGTSAGNVPLGGGGGYGASEVDLDNAGIAYVTTGNTITQIGSIDGAPPSVSQFGSVGTDFHSGIAFTGGQFRAGHLEDTGALVVSDGISEKLFAITPVPEPASASAALAVGGLMFARRRARKGGRR